MLKTNARLARIVPSDDDVVFPTLTQLEVWGLCAYTRLRYERWRAAQHASQDSAPIQDV